MEETFSRVVPNPDINIRIRSGITCCNGTEEVYFSAPFFLKNPYGTIEINFIEDTGCVGIMLFVIHIEASSLKDFIHDSTSFYRFGIIACIMILVERGRRPRNGTEFTESISMISWSKQ
jgi:hypothetical protein